MESEEEKYKSVLMSFISVVDLAPYVNSKVILPETKGEFDSPEIELDVMTTAHSEVDRAYVGESKDD